MKGSTKNRTKNLIFNKKTILFNNEVNEFLYVCFNNYNMFFFTKNNFYVSKKSYNLSASFGNLHYTKTPFVFWKNIEAYKSGWNFTIPFFFIFDLVSLKKYFFGFHFKTTDDSWLFETSFFDFFENVFYKDLWLNPTQDINLLLKRVALAVIIPIYYSIGFFNYFLSSRKYTAMVSKESYYVLFIKTVNYYKTKFVCLEYVLKNGLYFLLNKKFYKNKYLFLKNQKRLIFFLKCVPFNQYKRKLSYIFPINTKRIFFVFAPFVEKTLKFFDLFSFDKKRTVGDNIKFKLSLFANRLQHMFGGVNYILNLTDIIYILVNVDRFFRFLFLSRFVRAPFLMNKSIHFESFIIFLFSKFFYLRLTEYSFIYKVYSDITLNKRKVKIYKYTRYRYKGFVRLRLKWRDTVFKVWF